MAKLKFKAIVSKQSGIALVFNSFHWRDFP